MDFAAVIAAAVVVSHAQGRGGGAWTTVGGDAQRTSFVRTDAKISLSTLQSPGFQFLWKRKLDTGALTQPLLLPNIIAYKGFKALAFVGSASGHVYSIDYDLNRMFWEQKLASTAPKAAACSSGLPALTKTTPLSPPAGRGAGGNRGAAPGGAAATPPAAGAGRGAAADAPGRAGAPPAGTAPSAAGGGVGGFGGGQGGRGRGPAGPQIANGRGGGDNVFAISTGGMVHVMNPQVGTDQIPPVKFLPPNSNVAGSVLIDTTLYAATTGNCPGVPNGVWSIDLASDAKTVTSYDTHGAPVAGTAPPAFGTDGTLYISTGSAKSEVANAVVSLDSKTLLQKDWFSTATPFTSNPVVFQYKGKDLLIAANKDGRLYVLDSTSLGGADHKTPLHKSSQVVATPDDTTGLATLAGRIWNSLDRRDGRWNGSRGHESPHGQRPGDRRNARGVHRRGSERYAHAAAAVDVPRSRVSGYARHRQRRGVCPGQRRGQRSRPRNACPAVRPRRRDRQGTLDQRPDDHGTGTRGRPVGGRQPGVCRASDGTLYVFGMPMER